MPRNDGNIIGENNFLKKIILAYFFLVNLVVYLTIYIKNIEVIGIGVSSVMIFFLYLTTVFFVQDLFLKNKDFSRVPISSNIDLSREVYYLFGLNL